jgi:O-antigen ligase
MLGYVQMPKVFLLRSLALLLVALISVEWALSGPQRDAAGNDDSARWKRRWARVQAHPARLILLATAGVLAANVVSILLSPLRTVSFWGNNPGLDTYGLYSVLAYLVFFAVAATRLRNRRQIARLLWALTAASIVVSVYGIAQHLGFDPLKEVVGSPPRPEMSFGNPIFGAAYLIITMPMTVAVLMMHRGRISTVAHVALGGGLLATPLTAVILTLSRGPWVGGSAGIIVFLIGITWLYGWREARRPLGMIAIAAAIPLIIGFVPGTNAPSASFRVLIDRITSIGPTLSDGVSDRTAIWQGAWQAATEEGWVDTEQFPELPALAVPALRPLIGHGQDTFGYTFTAVGGTTSTTSALPSHAHNFLLHTAVELGALGVAAYVFLFWALVIVLLRLLYNARRVSHPYWFNYLVVGLIAVVVARGIEQMSGKAQISDLHLMWMLAAVVVALPTLIVSVSADRAATAGGGGERRANRRPSRRNSLARKSPSS